MSQTNMHHSAAAFFVNVDCDLQKLFRERFSVESFCVWYLGNQPGRQQTIEKCLPSNAQLGVLDFSLENIADRIEACLLDLSAQIDVETSAQRAWDVSALSDINPYSSTLQLNAVKGIFASETVQEGGLHLFFVDDDDVGTALATALLENGCDAHWIGKVREKQSIWSVLRARLSIIRQIIRHKFIALKTRNSAPIRWDALKECDALILDWVNPSTFSSEVAIRSVSNLERMPDVLSSHDVKVGYLANPLSWLFPFKEIMRSCSTAVDPVILIDECLSPISIIKGAWRTWRTRLALSNPIICDGFNIAALVQLEVSRDLQRPLATRSHAYEDVAKMLFKHGVAPKAIVYTYENQGWERTFIRGFRKYFPDCRLIGYQHCPFSRRMISFFPSPHHIKKNIIPDELIVMGPYYKGLLADRGFPKDRLHNGGSLRFENFYSKASSQPIRQKTMLRTSILCATSVEYSESLNLVLKAAQAVKNITNTDLVVTFHPKVDTEFIEGLRKSVQETIPNSHDYVCYSDQLTSELLKQVDVVLYNNSGAAFEAIMSGVAAIFVSVDGALDYDKVPDEIASRACSVENLKDMLSSVLSAKKSESQISDISIGGCISPIDEDLIVDTVLPS